MFMKHDSMQTGLFKGIIMAHVVLLLHLLLVGGIGLLVIFLLGVANYLAWILLGGLLLIALAAYLLWRRLRREGKNLRDTLRSPLFNGREVEVSLLGGLATMRVGKPTGKAALLIGDHDLPPQLEDPQTARLRNVQALADLLEKNLITRAEFDEAKRELFGP